MKVFRGFKWLDLGLFTSFVFAGFALVGCVTGDGGGQDSTSLQSPTQQAAGQATTVTAEGQPTHEEVCVPIAETDRVQPPSVEVGVARDLSGDSKAQAYTRYNCR